MARSSISLGPEAQDLFLKYTAAVVLVQLHPKCADRVKGYWNKVSPTTEGSETDIEREHYSSCKLHSTGFLFKETEKHFFVVTSAHLLSNLFSAEKPITIRKIKELYDAFVFCDHADQTYIEKKTPATVRLISCSMDLFVLRVEKELFSQNCLLAHPIIYISDTLPVALQTVMMISWPVNQERTVVVGRVSHPERDRSVLADDNVHGYIMSLTEVDIRSDFGSSGAPLLDMTGCCVGIMHSGNVAFSHFISVEEVNLQLHKWGLL